MANIVIGSLGGNSGTLAPGAKLTYNDDGTITGYARYQYLQNASVTAIGVAHPDDNRATGVSFTTEFDEVFLYADITYRGVWSTSACRVDVQASLSANPIETHPNFVSSLGGSPGSPLNGAVFDPTTGAFLGWPAGSPDNLGGVRYYLAVGNTYRFTFATASSATAASAISSIGVIASSITGGDLTVTSVFDAFMLQAVTLDYQSNSSANVVFTYSLVWVSTPAPGWNSNIYPP
jgi:hypothetical protein